MYTQTLLSVIMYSIHIDTIKCNSVYTDIIKCNNVTYLMGTGSVGYLGFADCKGSEQNSVNDCKGAHVWHAVNCTALAARIRSHIKH